MHLKRLLVTSSIVAGFVIGTGARAQTTTPSESLASITPEETVVLSPFKVTTDRDKGYRATNTTSGTRLDTEIKDLPMPIEVITEQFIRDIGADDLRQTLQYSGGIQLQTQNDWGSQLTFSNPAIPGRLNNPEGMTAIADQTHMKIRGFPSEATLRDGFRRQNSTDSVNIARVEVIRGPNALLYGVGNFGGVVNYMIKMPEKTAGGSLSATFGSYSFKRAILDYTTPITGKIGFRVSAAVQDTKDHTQYANENHYFVAPVIVWKPWANT
ncbi:MAG: TonB-dependent receptor plug domain-containing protein, partial [Opitutae bacterium]|nr:TonB-dependent receptor plug domain-containing protein [Opitutae bacterium]